MIATDSKFKVEVIVKRVTPSEDSVGLFPDNDWEYMENQWYKVRIEIPDHLRAKYGYHFIEATNCFIRYQKQYLEHQTINHDREGPRELTNPKFMKSVEKTFQSAVSNYEELKEMEPEYSLVIKYEPYIDWNKCV